MKTLSKIQFFVLETIFNGGDLITEDGSNEIHISDNEGNVFKIMQPTMRKLVSNDLIKIAYHPALNFNAWILTAKGLSEIQQNELNKIKS